MIFPVQPKQLSQPALQKDLDYLPDHDALSDICASAVGEGADFAEIYIERRMSTWISLAEDKINVVRQGLKLGAGVRVICGSQVGYAYCEDLNIEAIKAASLTAGFITREKRSGSFWNPVSKALPQAIGSVTFFPIEHENARKTDLVHRANAAARDENSKVREVNCTYYDEEKDVCIINSDGLSRNDQRSLYGFHVFVLVVGESSQNTGYAAGGGRYPFDYFGERTPEMIGREASEQALRKLKSRECPAGQFPVIINKGWGGVLIHEAVGHGLESDFVRRGSSVYTGKIGQKVASEIVTIIDDGTLPNGRGSLYMDDEGTPAQKNILIENGILKNYLYDTFNARLMNSASTGNGRRENFSQLPMPRMTNTYVARGTDAPQEIIRSVRNGLYAQTLGGGQVDITSGNFVFEVQEGYWIEDGKITYPVHGANLIGNGPEILKNIEAVGNDLVIETGTGTCGKEGQNIPVGVGQPTIKITEMTIGGTGLNSR